MIDEFVRLGFKTFFVVNTHLHDTQPLTEVLVDAQLKHGIKYGQIGWWQYIPSFTSDLWESSNPHGHAAEAGTSVLLYLFPELVHMEVAASTNSPFVNKWPGIVNCVKYAEHTDTGTLGDGTKGTVEKGRITAVSYTHLWPPPSTLSIRCLPFWAVCCSAMRPFPESRYCVPPSAPRES